MLKKVVILVTFIFLILIASYTQIGLIASEKVVFSKNFSQGEFVSSNIYDFSLRYLSKGYSFKLNGQNLDFLKELDAKEVYSSKIEKVENVYYYTNKIKKFQIINGKRVNVHIAKSQNDVIVGVPIIYYGY